MKQAEDAAAIVRTWLDRLEDPGAAIQAVSPPPAPAAALAALAAEALARGKTLLVVTPGDELLADISNALDLALRPLCLVLPAADYACRIALRATLSLLKSRLARAGADSEGSAWTSQRRRLADAAELWRECLAWSGRGLDSESWPQGLERLYPVRILPAALAGQLAGTPEWVVLTQPGSRPQPWPGAQRTLCFGGATGSGDLAATDETARLRGELDLLTQELADLELELATAQAEVADFAHRYHRLVGGPMAELDSLRAEIARQRAAKAGNDEGMAKEATEAKARASRSQREHRRFAEINEAAAKPFAPSGEIKKLYRHLAQKIHPDRAADEDERAWRTQLMTEANRAYRVGDAQALEELLALWREGARPGTAPTGGGLAAQVARLKSRVAAIETELNRLFGSRLYELFTAAQMARRKGRDLLQEMADRLEGEIAAAKGMLAGIS